MKYGHDVRGLGFSARYERKFNLVQTRALKKFKAGTARVQILVAEGCGRGVQACASVGAACG